MKLLIVDDEPIIREGIRSLVDMKSLGIEEIFTADNGEEALSLFKEYLPEIVLADINMSRMDGLTFAKYIKEIKASVCIALITGYDYFDYAKQAIKIGVDDYVLKPVSRKDITLLLKNLTEKVNQKNEEEAIKSLLNHNLPQTQSSELDIDYRSKLINYLEKHLYDFELSLQKMSDDMGLSMSYLSGLFKKEVGQSFKNYVLSKRLDQAKILILSTQMKNYEISEAIGIRDANYFSVVFKKHYGINPTQYREKHGQVNIEEGNHLDENKQ